MTILEEIKVSEIILGRKIPLEDSNVSLIQIIRDIIRERTRTAIILYDKEQIKLISVKSLAKHLAKKRLLRDEVLEETKAYELQELEKYEIFKPETNIKTVLGNILRKSIKPIIEIDGEFYEIQPEELFSLYVLWEDQMSEINVDKFMNKSIHKVNPNKSISSTIQQMINKGYDYALITNLSNQPLGILTYTDYVYSIQTLIKRMEGINISKDEKPKIDWVMKKPVIVGFETERMIDILNRMIEDDISHLPILSDTGEVSGMIYKEDIFSLLVDLDEAS